MLLSVGRDRMSFLSVRETARALLSRCYTTLGRASSPDEISNNPNNINDLKFTTHSCRQGLHPLRRKTGCNGILVGIRGYLGMGADPHIPTGKSLDMLPGHLGRGPYFSTLWLARGCWRGGCRRISVRAMTTSRNLASWSRFCKAA